MRVKIHTQGWVGDHGQEQGEEAGASLHVLLELDGQLIDAVERVAVVASNNTFTRVVATMYPGELETVVHDQDSWNELVAYAQNPRTKIYRGRLPWRSRRRPPT